MTLAGNGAGTGDCPRAGFVAWAGLAAIASRAACRRALACLPAGAGHSAQTGRRAEARDHAVTGLGRFASRISDAGCASHAGWRSRACGRSQTGRTGRITGHRTFACRLAHARLPAVAGRGPTAGCVADTCRCVATGRRTIAGIVDSAGDVPVASDGSVTGELIVARRHTGARDTQPASGVAFARLESGASLDVGTGRRAGACVSTGACFCRRACRNAWHCGFTRRQRLTGKLTRASLVAAEAGE